MGTTPAKKRRYSSTAVGFGINLYLSLIIIITYKIITHATRAHAQKQWGWAGAALCAPLPCPRCFARRLHRSYRREQATRCRPARRAAPPPLTPLPPATADAPFGRAGCCWRQGESGRPLGGVSFGYRLALLLPWLASSASRDDPPAISACMRTAASATPTRQTACRQGGGRAVAPRIGGNALRANSPCGSPWRANCCHHAPGGVSLGYRLAWLLPWLEEKININFKKMQDEHRLQ